MRAPLLGLACLAVLSATAAAAPGQTFTVTSTLDGKTVLPHRIHWNGLPTLPSAQIKEVDFLIDGKIDWIEHGAPYSFADDGGYLVTSFLTPGMHHFEVRAISTSGQVATDKIDSRVLPPPEVPAALAGTWARNVTDTSGAPAGGSKGNPTDTIVPPGTWKITFGANWIGDTFPCTNSPCTYNTKTGAGGLFHDDWTPGPKSFYVQGSVTAHMFKDSDRLAGWWCETWGPPATYNWSVGGDTLTLTPVGGKDACSIRGFIWAGQWTRVG